MPSPVGHALGGLIVGWALSPAAGVAPRIPRRIVLGSAVVAACLPDIDFLWGRHNMETHSLGFVALITVVAWAASRSSGVALTCALAAGSHVLFDWLGSDDFPPLGVMALWPFSTEFYFADAFIFATISRRYWLPGFVMHNVMAVARELVILLPILGVIYWFRGRGGNLRSGQG